MGCTLFKRFLPGITGFYWVLLGFTGFYWVLLGLIWLAVWPRSLANGVLVYSLLALSIESKIWRRSNDARDMAGGDT